MTKEMNLKEKAVAAQCNFAMREETIIHYLPVASRYAEKYANALFAKEDLEQIGVIAIIDVVDGYGYGRNYHISCQIITTVERAILTYIKKESAEYYAHICELENAVKMHSTYDSELVETKILREVIDEILDDFALPNKAGGYGYASKLSARESFVIEEYYLNETSTNEISFRFGVSCDRIYQIRARALRRLRHPSHRKLRDWYWETLCR